MIPLDESARKLLHHYLTTNVVKGEVSRKVLDYLFSMYGRPERICPNDITENGGPKSDGNVAAHMCRLRDQLIEHYDYDSEGRRQTYRVVLITGDRGNYSIVIVKNIPPAGFVPGLWKDYFTPTKPVVVYPELQCSCRHDDSSFDAATPRCEDDSEIAEYDSKFEMAVAPSRGFVSAGLVRSVLRFSECFRTYDVPIVAQAIRPSVDMVDGDIIVLATPESAPSLLAMLEATAYMKTGLDGVTINGIKDPKTRERFVDTRESSRTANGKALVKYVVVTRHHYKFQRTLTVLAAKDELAIEAVVQILTNEDALLGLARELKFGEAFPDHFQVLFAVRMVKGHPYARHITIERAIDLGRPS